MAKTGFPYYRAETDRFQDIRIKRLKKEFKGAGYAVYSYILNEIYRVKGCFLEWDESTAFDVSEYWDLKESQVNEIVKYCCAIGLFDKGLFTSGRVLTSLAIQSRYIDMSKIAKRTNYDIPKNICLIPEELIKLPEEFPELPEVPDKVKYSKEKNRKEISPSIPQGTGGESFLNLIDRTPPNDGVMRNWETLKSFFERFGITGHDADEIIMLSNYGQTSVEPDPVMPFWILKKEIEEAEKKYMEGKGNRIHTPGAFILSRLRNNNQKK